MLANVLLPWVTHSHQSSLALPPAGESRAAPAESERKTCQETCYSFQLDSDELGLPGSLGQLHAAAASQVGAEVVFLEASFTSLVCEGEIQQYCRSKVRNC